METQPLNLTPTEKDAVAAGYEPRDIRLKGIVVFGMVLVLTCAVVLMICWYLFNFLLATDSRHDAVLSPTTVDHPPAAIPLQPSLSHNNLDREDLENMRKQNAAILQSSGTSPTGRNYISIDDAMNRVLPLLPKKPGATTQP